MRSCHQGGTFATLCSSIVAVSGGCVERLKTARPDDARGKRTVARKKVMDKMKGNGVMGDGYEITLGLHPTMRQTVKSFGVNQSNINGTKPKGYPFPYTTLEEQHLIVAEIESRLSACDKIEETIKTALKQAEALRQSILKKAFEGKLVPQDPSDEPTSALLARIRAERERGVADTPRPR
jgi:hypothetical protein